MAACSTPDAVTGTIKEPVMFLVCTPGYPMACAHMVGTRAECLRYILKKGLRQHAWLEPLYQSSRGNDI